LIGCAQLHFLNGQKYQRMLPVLSDVDEMTFLHHQLIVLGLVVIC